MEAKHEPSLRIWVDLEVMAVKEYSTLARSLEQEPHYQI